MPPTDEKKHAAVVDVVAGGLGGAFAKSLLCPFQRIVVLQQLGQHREYNAVGLARLIYGTEGIKGFWRGNLTSMIIRVPYSGIQFLLYSRTKFFFQDWLNQREAVRQSSGFPEHSHHTKTFEKFVLKCGAGGLSATVAGIAVYPGEVVRVRLMSAEKQYSGIWHTCRLIYRETNSFRNFYRGMGASLMQRVPDILVSFATYETIKYGMLEHFQGSEHNYKLCNVLSTIVGGAAAALASIAVAFPLDIAKRRIAMSGQGTDKTVYKGAVDCLRILYRREGLRGWYAGSATEAVRCVPQVILMWFAIEGIQNLLTNNFYEGENSDDK